VASIKDVAAEGEARSRRISLVRILAVVTFIFPVEEARKVTANAVRGEFTPQAAVVELLRGTGLQPRVQADGALTVDANRNSMEQGETMRKRGLIASIIAVLAGSNSIDVRADQDSGVSS